MKKALSLLLVLSLSLTAFSQSYKQQIDNLTATKLNKTDTTPFVRKITGKGLSANDFSNAYKAKLDSLAYKLGLKSDVGHGHVIGDVTNLQTALNAKYSASDTAATVVTKGYVDPKLAAKVSNSTYNTDLTADRTALQSVSVTAGQALTLAQGLVLPSSISGLTLWIEPRINAPASGTVASIADLSGNGNTFSQLGTTPTPSVSTATFGGNKSLLFSGAQTLGLAHASSASLATMQTGSYTFVFLFRQNNINDLNTIFAKGGGGPIRTWFMTRSEATGMSGGGGFFDAYTFARAQRPAAGKNRQFFANTTYVVSVRVDYISSTKQIHTIRVNGELAGYLNTTLPSINTTDPWTISAGYQSGSPNWFGNNHIGLILAYNSALSDANLSKLEAYAANLGNISLADPTSPMVDLIDGDSISFSDQPDTGSGWPVLVKRQLPSNVRMYNRAIGSRMLVEIVTDGWLNNIPRGDGESVAVCFAGTNDIISAGRTDSQIYADLQTWCNAFKNAGWKTVVATMLPRGAFTTQQNTYRTAYNAKILAGFADGTLAADAVADVGNDATLANTANNTYYNGDGTHPNAAGQAIMAPYFLTAIRKAMGKTQVLPIAEVTSTATDADYTIANVATITKLPTITANRVVTLPSASTYAGKTLSIWNKNTSGSFTWSFSATVKDASDATITTLTNATWYNLKSDGTSWLKTNSLSDLELLILLNILGGLWFLSKRKRSDWYISPYHSDHVHPKGYRYTVIQEDSRCGQEPYTCDSGAMFASFQQANLYAKKWAQQDYKNRFTNPAKGVYQCLRSRIYVECL